AVCGRDPGRRDSREAAGIPEADALVRGEPQGPRAPHLLHDEGGRGPATASSGDPFKGKIDGSSQIPPQRERVSLTARYPLAFAGSHDEPLNAQPGRRLVQHRLRTRRGADGAVWRQLELAWACLVPGELP